MAWRLPGRKQQRIDSTSKHWLILRVDIIMKFQSLQSCSHCFISYMHCKIYAKCSFSIIELAGEVTILFPAQLWHCADARCLVNRILLFFFFRGKKNTLNKKKEKKLEAFDPLSSKSFWIRQGNIWITKSEERACVMTQHTRSHEENAEFLTTCSIIIHRSIHTEKLSPFKIGVINSLGSSNQHSYHFGNYSPPSTHTQRQGI